ncbi:MAG: patatin [Lysobacterales bacterium 63-13]|nr:MAG: patatin [Xanthomonadales bacterium 63-13]
MLSLSGGGYRGLFTARILADLEECIGAPIATRFDLIAGTSIGGILALALALRVPAQRMVALFKEHGDQIFKKRRSFLGYLRSPYTQASLAALLESDTLFGQRTVGACAHRVIVPAINHTTGRPVLFKTPHHPDFSADHKHRLVDVALATSAAPGFFPRHSFNNCQYVDGGLFANAPGLLALHEAEHFLGQQRSSIHVMAIGTMSAKFTVDPHRNRDGGALDWGGWKPANMPKRLFGVSISAQETLVHHLLGHAIAPGQYHHIDEDLTDERARAVALDKTDRTAQEILLGSAAECAKRALGSASIQAMLDRLTPQPIFYHGENANPAQGARHVEVA